ncbi:MAG TPA: zinc ribbon domain-containing protein [Myxococcota bacterium]|nr:zinc ribbon domain-containing protein [Myxococcota bacterium]HRY92616.1 zinc ribbon domain-containing protein [Myxococcota bacterium]HSA20612.1 zinc ribbon domain-containing protein [Myxococcota bacterium]
MALCPKCGAQLPPADQFCGACGADRFKDSEGKGSADRAMSQARGWILAVGIIYALSGLAFYLLLRDNLPEGAGATLLATNFGLCAIHVGLFFWARTAPFPAAVVALVLFITVHVANAILDPTTLAQGLIVKALFLGALIRAVSLGHKATRAGQRSGGDPLP